jgi:hypothetical protein
MPEKLKTFLRDVTSAKVKADAADAVVIATLKKMTAEEFARVPRDVLDDLSTKQYADIVRAVAPEVQLANPEKTISAGGRHTRAWREYWTWIPTPLVALIVGLATGVMVLTAMVSATPLLEWQSYSTRLSRPAYVGEWPRCRRLSRWTDGCVYGVTTGMSWQNATEYLDIPESYLRTLNRHIPGDAIPAGSDLTVWRDRFPLQEAR